MLVLLAVAGLGRLGATDYAAMFEERVRSVVGLEWFIQGEIDRDPQIGFGIVVSEDGLIMLTDDLIPDWMPPDRVRDMRVHPLGKDGDGYEADFLGQDFESQHFFIRLQNPAHAENFVPVQSFGSAEPGLGEPLWGIAAMEQEWDFKPYLLRGNLASIVTVPDRNGLTNPPVATPGSAVFDEQGRFVGWGERPEVESKWLLVRGDRIPVGLQGRWTTRTFLLAEEVLPYVDALPPAPLEEPQPFLGLTQITPIEKEVARLFDLQDQGAVVVGDVMKDSPAEKAGLQSRDIIVAIDGERIPKFNPDAAVAGYFTREMRKIEPDEEVSFEVLRAPGDDPVTIEATMMQHPLPMKAARREYFDRLGFGIRDYTVTDGIRLNTLEMDSDHVVTTFVRDNSPAASAGLNRGDLITEINGEAVEGFEAATETLAQLEADEDLENFVLMIERQNETKVLRVKLD